MQTKEKKNWTAAVVIRQYFFTTAVFMMSSFSALAQSKNNTVPGLYSLYGVREVASQLWLKADGSFEFFFSYGALDRTGKGTWIEDNANLGRIVLNSKTRPPLDFSLVSGRETNESQTSIKISDPNKALLPFVLVRLHAAKGVIEERADSEGYIHIPLQPIQKIELAFELCADRFSTFIPANSKLNAFEFRFEPWIAEVFFNNIVVYKSADGLQGSHPLLEGNSYTYEKGRQ